VKWRLRRACSSPRTRRSSGSTSARSSCAPATYLVKPFPQHDLLPTIRAARARHEEPAALREEVESLPEALAARQAIARPKELLMEREGL
jgi:response regulator NasT